MDFEYTGSGSISMGGSADLEVLTLNYDYTASGGITLYGCTPYEFDIYVYYQYAIGSIVYRRDSAQNKGLFRKVAIKDVIFPNHNPNAAPLYLDTLNGLWNQNDLVSYDVASVLIDAYILQNDANNVLAAESCVCPKGRNSADEIQEAYEREDQDPFSIDDKWDRRVEEANKPKLFP